MTMVKVQLNLYYRQECHLCEDMLELIQPYLAKNIIDLTMIDIDTVPELKEKYGLLIPVLSDHLNQEICHYFFDKISFEKFLWTQDLMNQ